MSPEWEPILPRYSMACSRAVSAGQDALYGPWSTAPNTTLRAASLIFPQAGEHFYDLWHGEELKPETRADRQSQL